MGESPIARVRGSGSGSFNLGQTLWKLVLVRRDCLRADIFQHLLHLSLLLRTVIASHIAYEMDARTNRTIRATPAVLDGNTLLWFPAEPFHGPKVDGGIGLGSWLGKRRGSAVNVFRLKVFIMAHLPDCRKDKSIATAAHDCEVVFLGRCQLPQLLLAALILSTLRTQGSNNSILLFRDPVFVFAVGQLEVLLLLQADRHPTESLPNELDNELSAGVAVRDTLLGEDVISEPNTSFKGRGPR